MTDRAFLLILGGSGMLGHQLWKEARKRSDTFVALREVPQGAEDSFPRTRSYTNIDVTQMMEVDALLARLQPQWVINCVGIVKQSPLMSDPALVIKVNSLFPHQLAQSCHAAGIRLIHLSTDCVFSGRKGNYTEEDPPDPEDFYGRSKLLGEPQGEGVLVLRTSMVGPELRGKLGLLEWFLAAVQEGRAVQGYRNSIFSGLYTPVLARTILKLIDDPKPLLGLRHLPSRPISKYGLLNLLVEECHFPLTLAPVDGDFCDRSLNGNRLMREMGWEPPDWSEMARELAEDLRREHRIV